MKTNMFRAVLLFVIVSATASCSSDNLELQDDRTSSFQVMDYTYNSAELESMELINAINMVYKNKARQKSNFIWLFNCLLTFFNTNLETSKD